MSQRRKSLVIFYLIVNYHYCGKIIDCVGIRCSLLSFEQMKSTLSLLFFVVFSTQFSNRYYFFDLLVDFSLQI